MSQMKEIVAEILKFIGASVQTDTKEMRSAAAGFAKACEDVNSRLAKSAELLRKDERQEAVDLAEADPPLAATFELLDSVPRATWLDLCRLYGWPLPPELHRELMETVKAAVARHRLLKPLEDEYRRAIHTGTLQDKVAVLRKLRKIDPADKGWEQSQKDFEKLWIAELVAAAKSAIASNDEDSLKRIDSILSSPEWLLRPDPGDSQDIDSKLKEFRIGHLKEKAGVIIKDIASAYGLFDLDRLNNALSRWDLIAEDREFAPSETDLQQVREAREWAAIKNKEESSKREFQNLLESIQQMFDTDEQEFHRIDNAYSKLRQFEREIPDIIETRYRNAKAEHEVSMARAFKIRLAVFAALTIAAVAAAVFLVNQRIRHNRHAEWSRQIGSAVEAGKLDEALKLFDSMNSSFPNMASDPKFVSLRKSLDGLLVKRDADRARLKILRGELEKAAADGFQSDIPVEEKIREAEPLADAPDDTLALKRIKDAWQENLAARQRQRETEFLKKVEALEAVYEQAAATDAKADPAAFSSLMKKYEKEADAMAEYSTIAKDVYEPKAAMMKKRLQTLVKIFQDAMKERKDYEADLKQIHSDIRTIADFKASLERFSERYPEYPNSADISQVLGYMKHYLAAAALKEFMPATEMKQDKMGAFSDLAKMIDSASPWSPDFPDFLKYYCRLQDSAPGFKAAFEELARAPLINYYSIMARSQDGGAVEMISEEEPKIKPSGTADGKPMREISVLRIMSSSDISGVYWYLQENPSGRWDARCGGKILLKNLEIEDLPHITAKIQSYTKLSALFKEAAAAGPLRFETQVLDIIDEIKVSTGNPYRRLILLKHVMGQAEKISWSLSPAFGRRLAEIQDFMASFGAGYDYFNMPQKDVAKVTQFLKDLPDMRPEAEASLVGRDAILAALDRSVDFMGIVKADGDEKSAAARKMKFSGELWALRKDSSGKFRFHIVGNVKDGASMLDPAETKSLSDCEPLFAPTDGKRTLGLAAELQRQAAKTGAAIAWPQCWPVNGIPAEPKR